MLGLTQEALAEELDVAVSTVARWEQGATAPRAWQRRRLAEVLGVSLDDLNELLDAGAASVAGTGVRPWNNGAPDPAGNGGVPAGSVGATAPTDPTTVRAMADVRRRRIAGSTACCTRRRRATGRQEDGRTPATSRASTASSVVRGR